MFFYVSFFVVVVSGLVYAAESTGPAAAESTSPTIQIIEKYIQKGISIFLQEDVLTTYIQSKTGDIPQDIELKLVSQKWADFCEAVRKNQVRPWIQDFIQENIDDKQSVVINSFTVRVAELLLQRIDDARRTATTLLKAFYTSLSQQNGAGSFDQVMDVLKYDDVDKKSLQRSFNIVSAGFVSGLWAMVPYFGAAPSHKLSKDNVISTAKTVVETLLARSPVSVIDLGTIKGSITKVIQDWVAGATAFDYQLLAASVTIMLVHSFDTMINSLNGVREAARIDVQANMKDEYEQQKAKQTQYVQEINDYFKTRLKQDSGVKHQFIIHHPMGKRDLFTIVMDQAYSLEQIPQKAEQAKISLNDTDNRFGYTLLALVLMKYPVEKLLEMPKKTNKHQIEFFITPENINKANIFGKTPLFLTVQRAIDIAVSFAAVKEAKHAGAEELKAGYLNAFSRWLNVIKILQVKGAVVDDNTKKELLEKQGLLKSGLNPDMQYLNSLRNMFKLPPLSGN